MPDQQWSPTVHLLLSVHSIPSFAFVKIHPDPLRQYPDEHVLPVLHVNRLPVHFES